MLTACNQFVGQIRAWAPKIGGSTFAWRMIQRQFAKHVLKRDLTLTLENGRRVLLPRHTQFSSVAWVTRGMIDDGCETILRRVHPPGSAFFDIGAHIGFYSVLMSDVASKVFAIEPDPRMANVLKINLRQCGSSHYVAAALSNRAATVSFLQAAAAPQSKIEESAVANSGVGGIIRVPAYRLDDVWQEHGSVQVGSMKLDTEGHEANVIVGGMTCIERCRPIMLVETEQQALRGYWPALESLGYQIVALSERARKSARTVWRGGPADIPLENGMFFFAPTERVSEAITARASKVG
jgi:FkbM family methyltransferase